MSTPQRRTDMHASQRDILNELITKYIPRGSLGAVWDIGSYSVNGDMRGDVLARENTYTGVDIAPGPNVEICIDAKTWEPLGDDSMPYVISGSCLEHVEAPWEWVRLLFKKMSGGGICIVHLPFAMFEHRYPVDCYRILPDGLRYLFGSAGFKELQCGWTPRGADTYYVGFKPLL